MIKEAENLSRTTSKATTNTKREVVTTYEYNPARGEGSASLNNAEQKDKEKYQNRAVPQYEYE